jgi:hypothetical protein
MLEANGSVSLQCDQIWMMCGITLRQARLGVSKLKAHPTTALRSSSDPTEALISLECLTKWVVFNLRAGCHAWRVEHRYVI